MKINRQHRRIARVIWQNCIVDGIPDIPAFERDLATLREEKNRQKKFVFAALLERISLYLRENKLKISSSEELSKSRKEKILSVIGSTAKFIGGIEFLKDEHLIAGLRIEKGYDIEEYSVSRQLELLKNRLIKN